MLDHLRIAFFGSSLLSSYWNGAATYYRGILREINRRGARITFYEPDAYDRQKHRDIDPPDWAHVVVYEGLGGVYKALREAREADLLIKASGVGVFDEMLETEVLKVRRPGGMTAFWDVDAPATLDRVGRDLNDPFRALIPKYDLIFTYGGGDPVVRGYESFGARVCVPIYNALDPSTHHPVKPKRNFEADLSFLGNRLPDRESRVEEFFLGAAESCPERRFLLGGSGWETKALPGNVCYAGHVGTADHNAFNCSAKMVLNISRESMARYGFSPATRVFEAAGAGACIITDAWEGIEEFLEPGREVLVARDGREVADFVQGVSEEEARRIGAAARERILSEHTYAKRASQWEAVIAGKLARVAS